MQKAKNCLLIVPHEDDEILVGNKILLELLKNDTISFYVLFVTNGDYYPSEKDIRLSESIKGLESIGVPRENIIFLGYKDSCRINGVHPYNDDSYSKEYFTSGLDSHPEYCYKKAGEHHAYTRKNVKQDLKSCIAGILPSTIICVDSDSHSDHRMVSLLFDEAMCEILKETDDYYPLILKRYAYSGSLYGKRDYFTHENRMMLEADYEKYHAVDDRIEFFIHSNCRFNIFREPLYKIMQHYPSQNMTASADKYINDSVIAYLKRSDNLSLKSIVDASSGKPDFVNDFKIFDSTDIIHSQDSDVRCAWIPDGFDVDNRLSIRLGTHKTIKKIVIYKNPVSNCSLNKIRISADSGEQYEIENFPENSNAQSIDVDISEKCKSINFHIDSPDGKNVGIAEIEIYENRNFQIDILTDRLNYCENKKYGYAFFSRLFFKLSFAIYSFCKRQIPGQYEYMRQHNSSVFSSVFQLNWFRIYTLFYRLKKKLQ